jgi:hypothetical protein
MPASAQKGDVKFVCGTSQGRPATVVTTPQGTIPIIRWVSNAFGEEYPPEYRCKVVSPKFQQYYKDGKLNYLPTGYANSQPIVCVAVNRGGPCTGVLFTLKPQSDPWQTLTRLMNVRVQAAGPLNESTASSGALDNDRYIDMNEYLRSTPVDATATGEATPAIDTGRSFAAPTAPSVAPTAPSNGLW